jgi:hypothetical protein
VPPPPPPPRLPRLAFLRRHRDRRGHDSSSRISTSSSIGVARHTLPMLLLLLLLLLMLMRLLMRLL